MTDCYIYNNVVYNLSAPVISFESNSDHRNFDLSNNIFIGSGKLLSGKNTGSKFLGNVWWSGKGKIKFFEYNSLSGWAKSTGQEVLNDKIAGIQADPGLKGPFTTDITDPYLLNDLSGYTLRPDSRLRDRGLNIKSELGVSPPLKDFFGNPVPQGSASEPGIYEIK